MFDLFTLSFSSQVWLIILLLVTVSGLGLILYMINSKQDDLAVSGLRSKSPSELSPVLVNILVKKKLTADGVAAFILDLCTRGYLIISRSDQGKFSISIRRAADHHLEVWEKDILKRLLPDNATSISERLLSKESQDLWSNDIYHATRLVYQAVTASGFFTENPHLTRVKYKLVGLGYYFIGFIGLIFVAIGGYSSIFLLPLILMVVEAFLIFHFSYTEVRYTSKGTGQRQSWLELANYFKTNSSPSDSHLTQASFEKLLPYAVALGCGQQFLLSFAHSAKDSPIFDWFFSHEKLSDSQLPDVLIKFVEQVGQDLIVLKGPQVS